MEERAIAERVYRRLTRPEDVVLRAADIIVAQSKDINDYLWYRTRYDQYDVIYLRDHSTFESVHEARGYISSYLMDKFLNTQCVDDHERSLLQEMLHQEWITIMNKINNGEIYP